MKLKVQTNAIVRRTQLLWAHVLEKPKVGTLVFPPFLFKVHMWEFCTHNVIVSGTQFGKTKPYCAIAFGKTKCEKTGNSTRHM